MRRMNRVRRVQVVTWSLACFLFAPSDAIADGFDIQQFHPSPSADESFLSTRSGEVLPHSSLSTSMILNYAKSPLVRRDQDGTRIEDIVRHVATAHVVFSYGLFDRGDIGIDLPLILFQGGEDVASSSVDPSGGSLRIGDIRLLPRAQLYSTRESVDDTGLSLALTLDTHLPTGSSRALQGGDFRVGPRFAADYSFGGPLVSINIGYLYRRASQLENLTVGSTFSWHLGGELPLDLPSEIPHLHDFSLSGELYGRINAGGESFRRAESPTELVIGVNARMQSLRFLAGGGLGLVNGYGTPDFRVLLGIGWNKPATPPAAPPATPPETRAADPLPPPPEPEPQPEPQPEPECRAASVQSDCLNVPPAVCEDGVLRTHAAACEEGTCVYLGTEVLCAAKTVCGHEGDRPACVPVAECEQDVDCTRPPQNRCLDGILTTYPGVCDAGTCKYLESESACEDGFECGLTAGMPACVVVTSLVTIDEEQKRIDILDVVHFALGSANIEERSFPLLNQVAQVLENNPHITSVRVEGHTDSSGGRQSNIDLSQRRAESVQAYLVARGIAEGRLKAQGFGPDRPVEDNSTAAGKAANRRVEFHIEDKE